MDGIIPYAKLPQILDEAEEYTDTAIAGLPKGVVYKGAVNYQSNLPTSGQTLGDCYTVKYKGTTGTEAWGAEFIWGTYDGTNQWIRLGNDNALTLKEYDSTATPEDNVLYYVIED